MNKDRGKLLTIILLITIILMIFGLYTVSNLNIQEYYKNVPSWLSTFNLVGMILDIIALIGIWFWKKFAVYVYATSAVIGILIEALILKPKEEMMTNSLIGIVMYALIFWAISRKWKYFE